jgi:homoserine O-acetyltransferase
MGGRETTNPLDPGEADLARSPGGRALREHNDGHRGRGRKGSESSSHAGSGGAGSENGDGEGEGSGPLTGKLGTGGERPAPKVFSAQSYLRYQGDKVSPFHHSISSKNLS